MSKQYPLTVILIGIPYVERWPNPVVTRLCKGSERDVYGMQMDVVDRTAL